jgi:hypothetical protein
MKTIRAAAATFALTLLAATAAAAPPAPDGETTVFDRATLHLRAATGGGNLELLDGTLWTPVAATLADVIAARSEVDEVSLRLSPPAGGAHRVRLRLDGDTFARFGDWTTDCVEIVLPVPAAGEATLDALEVETRATPASPTLPSSGYIRVKKLNSGG